MNHFTKGGIVLKNLKKTIGFAVIWIFMFLLIPKIALAVDEDYKIWTTQTDVAADKQWKIKFNSKFNPSTINSSNVTITDELNGAVDAIVTVCDDGKTATVDAPKGGYIPGKAYTLSVENICNEKGQKLSKSIKAPFTIKKTMKLSQTIDNVTVKIRKVEQDTDSLRIYVTYINNSDKKVSTDDCLTKVVFNNKQYAYDNDFNFTRYYEKNITAPTFIEPTVSADSVIFLTPIANVDKINMVLSAGFEDYRFNEVVVNDMAKGQIKIEEEQSEAILSSLTQNNVKINLNRVVQDSDSLKVYVTYINNSDNKIYTGDCLTKIVANGKQYEYDSEFNFSRYYNKNVVHAQNFIEPTVQEKSVMYFSPISDVDKVNIVLSSGFEDYKFNDIKVQKE